MKENEVRIKHPEQRPGRRTGDARLPTPRVLLGGLREPETAGVQRLQPSWVEQDRVEVVGEGVAVFWPADVGVAWQALAVGAEVAALGLLQPDHIRRAPPYGGDVESSPVAPGVLLACVVERPPDVEAHYPDLMLVHSGFPQTHLDNPPIVAGEVMIRVCRRAGYRGAGFR